MALSPDLSDIHLILANMPRCLKAAVGSFGGWLLSTGAPLISSQWYPIIQQVIPGFSAWLFRVTKERSEGHKTP